MDEAQVILRLQKEPLTFAPRLNDQVLVGEEALLRVTRAGFQLAYLPRASAQWRSFPAEIGLNGLIGDPDAAVYLAWAENRVVGWAAAYPDADGWTEVLDLRVDASFRRQGHGGRLLDMCRDFAKRRGSAGLRLRVSDANPVACRFLEQTGFEVGGMDRLALAARPEERNKPLAQRACQLLFYCMNK